MIAHLIPGDWIEERRDAFVKEVQEERQVHNEGPSERLDVVILEDRQDLARRGFVSSSSKRANDMKAYFACDRDRWVRSEGGRLIVYDDHK